ncbi:glycosyltransferase family 2 protein [Sphingomonas sp.]|uniref:glycosyltransferase family 2 protein n=1 Tax=Sphingomonas sp. TaxID=28214 RepID=UPI0035C875E3
MTPEWTVVLPYYNEADYLAATLRSLDAQTLKPFRLILIDNASDDCSAEFARAQAAAMTNVEVIHLFAEQPGKVHALEVATPHVATPFVAFTDADTIYPPHYLATAAQAFADGGARVVAVMATDVTDPADGPAALAKRRHNQRVSRLWPRQTHTGGFGQAFRTRAYLDAGGYAHRHWRYVLMDHEIMERVLRHGDAVYPFDLWCVPSPRRADRSRVRWTLAERLLYHLTPHAAKNWYWHRFLGPRLARRRLTHLNLREKTWAEA